MHAPTKLLSPETLSGQNSDHGPGLFGRVDVLDQWHVLCGGGPVAGAQVDKRGAAGEVREVQQLSDLVGGEHEHGPSPQQPVGAK